MEEAPFIFGRVAHELDFTNREKETELLYSHFYSGINSVLISPRRWGKTSLVRKVAEQITKKNKKIKCCFIDLFNVKNEAQFYQLLAQEIIKATSTKWDERVAQTKEFVSQFIPKITYSATSDSDFSLGLDWKEVKKKPEQILNIAEAIAKAKGIKIIVCIDEFQNIAEFDDSLSFQKKLRANWQLHQHTSYCLFGSKRNMMMNVFTSSKMPFYKFGTILFLEKIQEKDWIPYIQSRFKATKKNISESNSQLIAQKAQNHPYYVQQLAQLCWFRTSKTCTNVIVEEALDSLLMQLSLLFQNITDSLSSKQVNLLKAVIDGHDKLSSKHLLEEYDLGTSANVIRIKEALINKEIIDIQKNDIQFLDPMFQNWLTKYYFI